MCKFKMVQPKDTPELDVNKDPNMELDAFFIPIKLKHLDLVSKHMYTTRFMYVFEMPILIRWL